VRLLRFLKDWAKRLFAGVGRAGWISAAVALAAVVATHVWLADKLEAATARTDFVKGEIAKLDKEIDEIRKLKDEVAALLARKSVVETLSTAQGQQARFLDQLARTRPEGVFLTSASQSRNLNVELAGYAASYGDVAEIVRRLGESAYFENPSLKEVRTEAVPRHAGYPVRFGVLVSIKRPAAPQAQKTAASTGGQK